MKVSAFEEFNYKPERSDLRSNTSRRKEQIFREKVCLPCRLKSSREIIALVGIARAHPEQMVHVFNAIVKVSVQASCTIKPLEYLKRRRTASPQVVQY